ncbi:MAG TPA: hypothetical protein VEX86_11980 [Longimicrobium sp.]|nr:hypothetical protein [Longimicrobium sp.]
MRKSLTLLLAVTVIVAVVVWWALGDFAVSVVPGRHTPILAPYSLMAILVSALLPAIAFATVFRHLGGRKISR